MSPFYVEGDRKLDSVIWRLSRPEREGRVTVVPLITD